MLRRLAATSPMLASLGLGFAFVACGSASPIDIGTDRGIVFDAEDIEAPVEPEEKLTPAEFDSFLDAGWERGEISPYCTRSFEACGGLLAGTWEVEDNCNPTTRNLEVLQGWGQARMALDETACWNAVQRLTSSWSGQLKFENGKAYDTRQLQQKADMQLTSTCLSATLGIHPTDSVAPKICSTIQDESTTCALAGGVCMCSNRTTFGGGASGVYGVLGLSVVIESQPRTEYEYCVDGDRLLWREQEGSLRQVVLKRTVAPPPGTMDPIQPH